SPDLRSFWEFPMTSTTPSPAGVAPSTTDTDVIVVGSGFGGSVTALRLTEKGYRVTVIEAGRRFEDEGFPKTAWRLDRYVWAPELGLCVLERVRLRRDVMILACAGVVGGSLNFANSLYKPGSPLRDVLQ